MISTIRLSYQAWLVVFGLAGILVYYQTTRFFADDLTFLYVVVNTIFVFVCGFFLALGNKYSFSLYHCFFLFYLLFFGITPPLEMQLGATYWGAPQTVFSQYSFVTILALVSILAFHFSYHVTLSSKFRKLKNTNTSFIVDNSIATPKILITLSFTSFFVILLFNNFSYVSVLLRGGDLVNRLEVGQIVNLIYSHILFPIPTIALVVYLQTPKSDRRLKITLLLFVLFILANPATGMARWKAGALYLAVFISLFPSVMNYRFLMLFLLSMGLLFIFPLLDKFRNFSADNRFLEFNTNFIYQGHFDTFQSFANSVEQNFITGGYQLLGTLLFFVPRSIWPSKPIGSGAELAKSYNFTFDNISMNFLAEGYVNFGILGVFLFALIAGFALANFDFSFRHTPMGTLSSKKIFSIFMVGSIFFILRGDLLSSFAYSTGTFLSIFMVSKIARIKFTI